jgi:hypothetical protein
MKSKKLFIYTSLACLLLSFVSMGFSADKIVQSKWTAQPPVIDGLDDDWEGEEMMVEKKVKVDYAIRNDAQSMYVLFVFNDSKYLSSINATGITFYYNTEGKKKKDHAYNFIKKKVTGEELIAYLKKRGEVLSEEQMQSINPQQAYSIFMTERMGKKDKDIPPVSPVPGLVNPGFKISKKGDAFVYEFRIPLLRSDTSPRGMGVEPGQDLKIGFEWGGMTEALMKRLSEQSGGTGVSSEGRAMNVPGSGRVTGAPGSASGRMPKKYSFWIDISLAQNQ